jgi:hypothetical protein
MFEGTYLCKALIVFKYVTKKTCAVFRAEDGSSIFVRNFDAHLRFNTVRNSEDHIHFITQNAIKIKLRTFFLKYCIE